MESSFADRIAAPLDPQFSWDKMSAALSASFKKLVDDPMMAILLYIVSGLHPHQWQMGAALRQPGSLDRKAWSHLGYCLDVE
eukprot:5820363-Pyramimonas_sp.AAC.1